MNDRGTLCAVGITNSGTVTSSSNQSGTTVGLVGTASSVVSAASASLERGELKASVSVNKTFASGIAQTRSNRGCGKSAGQSITPDIVNNPSGFGVGLYAETVRAAGTHDPFQFRAQFGNLVWWDIVDAGDLISPGLRVHIESALDPIDPPPSVPEPSTMLLLAAGAGALVSVRRRRTHAHRALRLGLQPNHRARPRVAVDGQIE